MKVPSSFGVEGGQHPSQLVWILPVRRPALRHKDDTLWASVAGSLVTGSHSSPVLTSGGRHGSQWAKGSNKWIDGLRLPPMRSPSTNLGCPR